MRGNRLHTTALLTPEVRVGYLRQYRRVKPAQVRPYRIESVGWDPLKSDLCCPFDRISTSGSPQESSEIWSE